MSSSPEALRLTASKDKGLRTLLNFIERSINLHILSYLDVTGDFEFAFQGFDQRTDTERSSLDTSQVHTWKTLNELRKEHGADPLPDGDIVLDSTYLQAKQAAAMGGGQDGLDNGGGDGDNNGNGGAVWKPDSRGTSGEVQGEEWEQW